MGWIFLLVCLLNCVRIILNCKGWFVNCYVGVLTCIVWVLCKWVLHCFRCLCSNNVLWVNRVCRLAAYCCLLLVCSGFCFVC